MVADFVIVVKCTIFWLNRGLMGYLDFYVPDFPKSISNYFFSSPKCFSRTKVKKVIQGTFFINLAHTNQNIQSNLYGAKVRDHTLSLAFWRKTVEKENFGNLMHTNQKIPSNLYCAKI